jgi:hypothetical protein
MPLRHFPDGIFKGEALERRFGGSASEVLDLIGNQKGQAVDGNRGDKKKALAMPFFCGGFSFA